MRSRLHWILYVLCFPWDLLVAWPAVLLIRLFWGCNLRWEKPPYAKSHGGGPLLACQLRRGSLPVRDGRWPVGWYTYRTAAGERIPWGGTALGHAVFYGPDVAFQTDRWSPVQVHEHVHVEQFEAGTVSGLLSIFVALGSAIIGANLGFTSWMLLAFTFFPIWFFGYCIMATSGWITAWLRGESPYRGSQHEESAYAQTPGRGGGQ